MITTYDINAALGTTGCIIVGALLIGWAVWDFWHAARCCTDDRSDWKATRGPG